MTYRLPTMPRRTALSVASPIRPDLSDQFDNGYFALYSRIDCGHEFRVETEYGQGPQNLKVREARPCHKCAEASR